MPNEAANEEQTFLIGLLRATYQNQELYPILQDNLTKLNNNLALILRKWVSDRFTKEPANAINIARVIVKLSTTIQSFEQGNPAINLEIAIAGYEVVLHIYNRETFPKESNIVQQALVTAYQQRQDTLSKTLGELQQQTVQTQTQIKIVTEQLQQELQQANLQFKDLNTIIRHFKQQEISSDSTSLITELHDLKQRQIRLEEFTNTANELPKIEKFNTAIFYDIENLTMGRNEPNLNFSLKQIQTDVEKVGMVNKIAIQCAYADWSDSRLRLLKNQIQELGIEAVQIFDYSHKRNAADMQLAIDVMELAQSRPTLEVFVIVSGDGAFAALAKKLHEYGKSVIGCAYEGQMNRVLKSVCDRFLPIPAPQAKTEDIQVTEVTEDNLLNDEIFVKTNKILQELQQNSQQASQLQKAGIPMSQIHQILKNNIPNFDEKQKKYNSKFTNFIKIIIEESNTSLDISNNKLIWREKLNQFLIAHQKNLSKV
ncbi:NYN domain-containing protein [Nostoc sp. CCY 9925]|uniref:NYN domain-containing protein n=1 Tax=Nostoc sp. CCY 9925 TaxID=3103865 RepID=UPI0039C5ED0B